MRKLKNFCLNILDCTQKMGSIETGLRRPSVRVPPGCVVHVKNLGKLQSICLAQQSWEIQVRFRLSCRI